MKKVNILYKERIHVFWSKLYNNDPALRKFYWSLFRKLSLIKHCVVSEMYKGNLEIDK